MLMPTSFARHPSQLRRAVAGVAALLASWGADAVAQTAGADPGAGAAETKASSERSVDIEDSSLEGLLDLDLEDRLGKTEAVSRRNESVLRAPASMTTVSGTELRLAGVT